MPKDDPVIFFFLALVGTFLALFLSVMLFIFFVSYHKRKLKYIKDTQQLQTNFQQEMLRTQLEIQEQTFKNISQDIHDNIGQMLSLVKLNLNTVDINQPDIASEKVQRSRDLVSKVISDLRDLSKSLNPEIIMKVGLSEAVQRELLIVAKTAQFNANLSQNGNYYQLDPQKELIIFRTFQEMLNNIIKHSGAKTVNVLLEYQPQLFSLTVSDDGKGFDLTALESQDDNRLCLGIRNMRNRAKLIGGELKLMSILEKGTIISIELPFQAS